MPIKHHQATALETDEADDDPLLIESRHSLSISNIIKITSESPSVITNSTIYSKQLHAVKKPTTKPPEVKQTSVKRTSPPKSSTEPEIQKSSTSKYYIPKRATAQEDKKKGPLPDKTGKNSTGCIVWSDTEDEDEKEPLESDDDYGIRKQRKFKPKLYDFELDDYGEVRDILIENERKFDDNCNIRCPDFAILMDHLIAMIWYFYRDWKYWNDFNVPQLDWAIKFLDGVICQEQFTHIAMIKRHLQELLFIRYTEVPEMSITLPEARPPSLLQLTPDLPVSLQAILNRAPQFRKYLSTTAKTRSNISRKISELDAYYMAHVQLLKTELVNLSAYERRHQASPTGDTELTEIINKVQNHVNEIVRIREQIESH